MAWTKVVESLLPEARAFLEAAVPKANERLSVVLKAAEKQFGKDQPEVFKQINEAAFPAAAYFRSVKSGQSLRKVGPDVLSQWLADTEQLAPGTVAAAKGAAGGAPTWQRSHLPVDLSPISMQAKMRDLQDQLKRYSGTLPGDEKARAKVQAKLDKVMQAVRGQQLIKDMPRALYLSPLSPVTKSDVVLGVKTRFPSDVAAAMATQDANTKNLRSAWRSVANWFPNVGETRAFKKDMRKLWEDTLPLQERYYRMREGLVAKEKAWGKLKSPEAIAKAAAEKDKFVNEKILPVYKELQARRHAAFSKYFDQPDVRIALYREPETRPWVEHLMQPKEIEVANWHKQLMDNARATANSLGIPVRKQDEEYITHLIRYITKGGKAKSAEVQAYIDRMLPKMVRFAHRTPGSLMFYPSVRTITDSYITGASRKFALTELMGKYQPIIEGPLKQWPTTQQYFTKYFKQYTEKLMDDSFYEKLFRGTTWWMYLSKTATSLSVARKHAEKGLGLLATHPYDVARAIAPATRAGLQLAFQRFGAVPGSEARLIRNYLSSRSFFEAMSGVTAPERQRLQSVINLFSAFPTNFVEITERGLGTMTAMGKGMRKGLSHNDMASAIWQILIDQSFIGKADRFLWLQKPWQQLLFLFAYTPGRLTDTTIKRVLMSLPKRTIQEMKEGVLSTAWRFPTDVFGTPYVKNTLMFAAGIGAVEALARHYDTTIWKEIAFHLHLLREKGGETELYFWPYDVYKEGVARGGKLDDPRPFISAVLDNLLTFPQWQRYMRVIKGDIPEVYQGSKARALTALPSISAQERLGERFRPRKEKQAAKAAAKATKRREESWPVGPLLQYLPPHVRKYLGY